jgi:serine/threonine-protein kinase
MKRVLPVFLLFVFVLSACGQAAPTAVTLPTAVPTLEIVVNPTEKPQDAVAGDVRTSTVDGMIQAFVPGGSFQMGGFDEDAQDDEKPAHKVSVGPFWMDKVEVTNAMYSLCVQAGACTLPNELKSATRPSYFANAEFNDYPVVYVSYESAKSYCSWAGRRLPTEAEWEFAARGSADFRRYPWGDQSPTNNLANYDYAVRDTTRVGSYPNGASPFGILDMSGNVWEWVADFYNPIYYQGGAEQNPTGPSSAGVNGLRRGIRGGSWQDSFKDVRLSNRGFAIAPDLTSDSKSSEYLGDVKDSIGFRCVSGN